MTDVSATDATTTADTVDTEAATAPEKDWQAEADKWKRQSQKQEERAKANAAAAAELAELRKSTMTDLEKAVAEAHAKGRAEGAAEAGSKLVAAELRAALAGRNVDVDALLEGVNQSRFIGDDGDPDREAIGKWVDRIAPIPEQPENPLAAVLDLGQGQRSGSAMALNGDPLERALKSKLGIT